MKDVYYKCIKDIPGIKAGEIFIYINRKEVVIECWGAIIEDKYILQSIVDVTEKWPKVEKYPQTFATEFVENNPDWFEKIGKSFIPGGYVNKNNPSNPDVEFILPSNRQIGSYMKDFEIAGLKMRLKEKEKKITELEREIKADNTLIGLHRDLLNAIPVPFIEGVPKAIKWIEKMKNLKMQGGCGELMELIKDIDRKLETLTFHPIGPL